MAEVDNQNEGLQNTVKANVNFYAAELRKRADKDYISARLCYQNGLLENFLWDAQQCLEKYLKAIALFQKIDVKNSEHNLEELFKKIKKNKNQFY